jgi:hypothetical protein
MAMSIHTTFAAAEGQLSELSAESASSPAPTTLMTW